MKHEYKLSKKDFKKNYMQYISDKMKFEQNEIIINSHMQFRSPTLLYIVKVMFDLKQKFRYYLVLKHISVIKYYLNNSLL